LKYSPAAGRIFQLPASSGAFKREGAWPSEDGSVNPPF
jgi:hypothetical protein